MKSRRKTVRAVYEFVCLGHEIKVIAYKLGDDFHPRHTSYVTIDHKSHKYVEENDVNNICLYLMREGFIPEKFEVFLWDKEIKFWEMYKFEYDENWEDSYE